MLLLLIGITVFNKHHCDDLGFYLIPLTRHFPFSFSLGFSEEKKAGLFLFNCGTLLN